MKTDIDPEISEKIDRVKTRSVWDKRVVVCVEIIITVIALGVFIVGLTNDVRLLEDIGSNVFTAMMVTVAATVIPWKTETDVEKTVREVTENANERISKITEITQKTSRDLEQKITLVNDTTKKLNETVTIYQNMMQNFMGKSCSFCKNHIKAVVLNRRECNLGSFFQQAKTEICILATSLDSFKEFFPDLLKMATNGVKVKIAAIHPDVAMSFFESRFGGISHQPNDEGDESASKQTGAERTTPQETYTKMLEALRTAQRYDGSADDKDNNFEVVLYKANPSITMIMVDNECYVAYLLHGVRSKETIHFLFEDSDNPEHVCGDECDKNCRLKNAYISPVKHFKTHFNNILNDKNTKSAANYAIK